MEKAFSDRVVESSNIDGYISSEVEDDCLKLDANELTKSLKNIPSFNKKCDVDDVESNGKYI